MVKDTSNKVLPSPQLIISEVAAYYNINESVIRGSRRDKNTAEARQVSMYLIRKLTNLSLLDTAAEFGKDHTTVMHSVDKIEKELGTSDHLSRSQGDHCKRKWKAVNQPSDIFIQTGDMRLSPNFFAIIFSTFPRGKLV